MLQQLGNLIGFIKKVLVGPNFVKCAQTGTFATPFSEVSVQQIIDTIEYFGKLKLRQISKRLLAQQLYVGQPIFCKAVLVIRHLKNSFMGYI